MAKVTRSLIINRRYLRSYGEVGILGRMRVRFDIEFFESSCIEEIWMLGEERLENLMCDLPGANKFGAFTYNLFAHHYDFP